MDKSRKNRRLLKEKDTTPQLEVMMSSNHKPKIKGKFKTYQHSCFMVIGVIGQ